MHANEPLFIFGVKAAISRQEGVRYLNNFGRNWKQSAAFCCELAASLFPFRHSRYYSDPWKAAMTKSLI